MTKANRDAERLRSIHIFDGVRQTDLLILAQKCQWREYKEQQTIIYQDDDGNEVYLLCEGTARATLLAPSGVRMVSYELLTSGQIFGEMSAIDHQPRSTNVVAMEDCTVASMKSADFIQLLADYPAVSLAVLQKVTATVRALCTRVFEYRALPVSARIDHAIIKLAEAELLSKGEDEATINASINDPIAITHPPTQEALAEHVDTTREAVANQYSLLHKLGIIDRHRRKLVVLDLAELRRRVEQALLDDD